MWVAFFKLLLCTKRSFQTQSWMQCLPLHRSLASITFQICITTPFIEIAWRHSLPITAARISFNLLLIFSVHSSIHNIFVALKVYLQFSVALYFEIKMHLKQATREEWEKSKSKEHIETKGLDSLIELRWPLCVCSLSPDALLYLCQCRCHSSTSSDVLRSSWQYL